MHALVATAAGWPNRLPSLTRRRGATRQTVRERTDAAAKNKDTCRNYEKLTHHRSDRANSWRPRCPSTHHAQPRCHTAAGREPDSPQLAARRPGATAPAVHAGGGSSSMPSCYEAGVPLTYVLFVDEGHDLRRQQYGKRRDDRSRDDRQRRHRRNGRHAGRQSCLTVTTCRSPDAGGE